MILFRVEIKINDLYQSCSRSILHGTLGHAVFGYSFSVLDSMYKRILFIFAAPSMLQLGCVWLEGWKSGRIKNDRRMEKWEDRNFFNLSHFCLVGNEKVERWKK